MYWFIRVTFKHFILKIIVHGIVFSKITIHGIVSDNELLIAKFRFKLKKVGKTTRLFRYDLNQILYNYTGELTNRFKGFKLIECLKNYGQRRITLYRRPWSKLSTRRRNAKGKMIVSGGLTNSWERREAKGKGEKERYTHLISEF